MCTIGEEFASICAILYNYLGVCLVCECAWQFSLISNKCGWVSVCACVFVWICKICKCGFVRVSVPF